MKLTCEMEFALWPALARVLCFKISTNHVSFTLVLLETRKWLFLLSLWGHGELAFTRMHHCVRYVALGLQSFPRQLFCALHIWYPGEVLLHKLGEVNLRRHGSYRCYERVWRGAA
jgi:hypothetical protein